MYDTIFILAPSSVQNGWELIDTKDIDVKKIYSRAHPKNETWVLDKNGKVFYKSDGSTPKEVHHSKRIISLSIGGSGIWVVDEDGDALRRFFIDDATPYGKYWKPVPQNVRLNSVFSSESDVFGKFSSYLLSNGHFKWS